MSGLLFALKLSVVLHSVDGREMLIDPLSILRLEFPRRSGDPTKQYHKDVNCVVYTVDGRQFTVVEDCTKVQRLLESAN